MVRNCVGLGALSVMVSLEMAFAEELNVFRKFGTILGLMPDDRDRIGTSAEKIHVIGAGLPRTGTASLRAALEELGYRTHHMEEVFLNPRSRQTWLDYSTGLVGFETVIQNTLELGFNATVDMPTQAFYKELMHAFPDAKVLLSIRDKAEDWVNSFTTLQKFMTPTFYPPFVWMEPFKSVELLSRQGEILRHTHPHFNSPHPQVLKKVYEEWVAEVKRVVPSERLLEFNVKEGWTPLCTFLGVPVPKRSFPRVNDGANMRILSWILWFVVVTWPIYPFIMLSCVLRRMSHWLCGKKSKRD